MAAKTRKKLGKSNQSGSSRKPRNLDLPDSHAGAVKGGEVSHSEFGIVKTIDKSTSVLHQK